MRYQRWSVQFKPYCLYGANHNVILQIRKKNTVLKPSQIAHRCGPNVGPTAVHHLPNGGPTSVNHRWPTVGATAAFHWAHVGSRLLGQHRTNSSSSVSPTPSANGGAAVGTHRWANCCWHSPVGQRQLTASGPPLAQRQLTNSGTPLVQRWTNVSWSPVVALFHSLTAK